MSGKKKASDDPRFDRLAELLRGTDPQRLRSLLVKDAVVNFRVSASDKAGMTVLASECGLSVSELMTRLYYFADGLLSKKAGRRSRSK